MSTVAEPVDRTSPRRAPAMATVQPPPRLGEQLVGARLVTEEQLASALGQQQEGGRRLGEILLDLGFVTEEDLLPFIEQGSCGERCAGSCRKRQLLPK